MDSRDKDALPSHILPVVIIGKTLAVSLHLDGATSAPTFQSQSEKNQEFWVQKKKKKAL